MRITRYWAVPPKIDRRRSISAGEIDSAFVYEDRTRRFFPPAPRVPRMPGLNAGDADLSQLVVLSFGELTENLVKPKGKNVLKDEEYAEVQKFSLSGESLVRRLARMPHLRARWCASMRCLARATRFKGQAAHFNEVSLERSLEPRH
ncbi:hypothetical protein GW17_00025443 [Ensete ventricosum]|nr:hypothetical protein GW17_00025443 [Ensete ventricosum]RZS22680.1 hypothetical protein BHM03_00055491 [Ensete ventricosum]